MKQFAFVNSIICCLMLLIGCQSERNSSAIVQISPAGSTDFNWLEISDTAIVALETSEECMIDRIVEIKRYNSDWYVLTGQSSILKFDESGKFITTIGSKGSGPGEYMHVNTINVSNGRVYINEGNQEKVCVYDIDGKWIEDIKETNCLKFAMSIQSLSEDKFLIANSICFKKGTPLYGIWNLSDPKQLTPVVDTDYSYSGSYEWAMSPLAKYNDGYLALKPLSSTIFRLDTNNIQCDSVINIKNCIPSDLPSSENYTESFASVLSHQGNPIMGIQVAGDFAVISMMKAFSLVHLPSGQYWYANTQNMPLQKRPLPFMLTDIGCTYEDKLVCVVNASDYLNECENKTDVDNLQREEVDPEDNPLLMIYTLKYIP